MNERDLQLARVMGSEIDTSGDGSIYLLATKYTNIVRLNLVLLKFFLDEQHKRGIMITIDRPHQYISHLLVLHGVSHSNLSFIDAISVHSSDTKGGSTVSGLEGGPFQIETLPAWLLQSQTNDSELVKTDFIIMDNVASLLTYNTMLNVMKFIQEYVRVIGELNGKRITTAFVIDKDLQPELYEFISNVSKKCVDIGPDMVLKQVVAPESVIGTPTTMPSIRPQSPTFQATQGFESNNLTTRM